MNITRDNVAQISNMEIAQILGTLWMMLYAPEAKAFISDIKELKLKYELVKDDNLRRFGVESVGSMLRQLQNVLDMRRKDMTKQSVASSSENNKYFAIRNSQNSEEYLHPTAPTATTYIWVKGLVGAAGFTQPNANRIAQECTPKGEVIPFDSLIGTQMKVV